MIKRVKNIVCAAFAVVCFNCIGACSKFDNSPLPEGCGTEVGIRFGSSSDEAGYDITRTCINSDGLTASWSDADKVGVWALDSKGSFFMSAQQFSLAARGDAAAYFTADLPQPMPEGTYLYMACYPYPSSVDGTKATFSLAAGQDGKAGMGSDIMVAIPQSGVQLKPLDQISPDDVNLHMKHLVHVLNFYVSDRQNFLDGDRITKIVVSLPEAVAGSVTVDVADPLSSAEYSPNGNVLTLTPEKSVAVSGGAERHYVSAAIFPVKFAASAKLSATIYTENHIAFAKEISVGGRDMQAGHATAVQLDIAGVQKYYTMNFRYVGNNIGESVQKITVSSPDGLPVCAAGGSSYTFAPGGDIELGKVLTLDFSTDASAWNALGGKKLNLTFESQHVIVRQSLTVLLPIGGTSYSASIAAPYLLQEDFSSVQSFSSNDEYKTSSTGTFAGYAFMNGWSGGRIGAKAGSMVRIGARREAGLWAEALYDARVESSPIAQIKSPVDLKVTFNYGANNGRLDDDNNLGETVYVGYVTSTKTYKSGDDDGTFTDSFHISTSEFAGDWNAPYTYVATVNSVPAGATNRISWRNRCDSKKVFAGNTTVWLYLDNVTVQVK